MKSPQDILDSFSRGRIDCGNAARLLSDAITKGLVTVGDINHLLERESRSGKLPRQHYIALKEQLDDQTRLDSPARVDAEGTLVSASRLWNEGATQRPAEGTRPGDPALSKPARHEDLSNHQELLRTQVLGGSPATVSLPGRIDAGATSTGVLQSWTEGALSNEHGRHALKVGDTLKERFVLEALLGSGGMGVVFKALDLRKKEANDRDPYVALKVLNEEFRSNPVSLIALQREAKRAQALSHPNVINVFDFDRDGSYVFMSMEYLPDQPLSHFIRQLPEGGLSWKRAWPIIQGMGSALAYAHKKNIIHSDFKPANVFINSEGDVKVLDFGIACAAVRSDHEVREETLYDPRSIGALTPAYASLEMFQDEEPDPRDDIYALACVSYELLTGKHPFGKLTALQAQELNLQPKPVRTISRKRWHALQHGLALKRADRTRSVELFVAELQGRSATYYAGWAFSITMVALLAGSYYYFTSMRPLAEQPPPPVLTAKQADKIKDLLDLAEIHFDVGYLTAPTGSNALWAYREVLKIDPYNKAAINGIKKISDTLEQDAWESFEKGDRVESLNKVNEGLQADPQHAGLLKLKRKLQD